MRERVQLKAPAKINLTLKVVGKRTDGYHELETVMQQIDLCDEITIITANEGIGLAATTARCQVMRQSGF